MNTNTNYGHLRKHLLEFDVGHCNTLSMHEYTLVFSRTGDYGNADAVSQLPLRVAPTETVTPTDLVLLMQHLADSL